MVWCLMPVIDPLYPYWAKLATHQGWDQDQSDAAYQSVVTRYDEQQRHFHVRQHLSNIFNALPLENYSDDEQAELIATVFWHDAIYDTSTPERAAQNEEFSAVVAGYDLFQLGSSDAFIDKVEENIRNSKAHKCDAVNDPVGAMFLDCDMQTLSGTWDQYCIGSKQIDAEYAAIPSEKFCQARLKKFIDPLLAADAIYLLPENEAKWGKQARANLTMEKTRVLQTMLANNWSTDGIAPLVQQNPQPK